MIAYLWHKKWCHDVAIHKKTLLAYLPLVVGEIEGTLGEDNGFINKGDTGVRGWTVEKSITANSVTTGYIWVSKFYLHLHLHM